MEFVTTGGRVLGTRAADGIVTARGIPYAAPPFGARRFQPPAPPLGWSSPRECHDFGPVPPQRAVMPGTPTWTPGEEDVLTVNVWAPEHAQHAPVLVWLYGGAYIFGSSAEPLYDGTPLARTGLVVVSCNYRVGFEGFGHVPDAPDNRALLDQAAALAWVRDNIEAFGGDPGNVTVAGESAGAGSVMCLMAMPEARYLFHRAIAHSIPRTMLRPPQAATVSERIAEAAGTTVESLAKLAPEQILDATDVVLAHHREHHVPGFNATPVTLFAPVIDGITLPRDPLPVPATSDIPLLALHTLHEYRLFAALDPALRIDDDAALTAVAAELGLAPAAVESYRELHPGSSRTELFCAMKGDALFTEVTARAVESHAAAGGRAHLARLALESGGMQGWMRACHALDLPLVFGNLDVGLALSLLDGLPREEVAALSKRMMRAWADFARHGDPGWDAATPQALPVREWNLHDRTVARDDSPVRNLWSGVPL
ncbi:carboxylesterase family protein [Lipingzhangella sp. LS1_29]|uniref:Carboxylic ester hydrolase n=1 Tax=Lipingzhangella rawalii TaxID=2055835 RepID=A0ABU2H6P5_9ACTN|nr:carboxylesterase family protein [Lipingzhangella rawalii]MDS1270525.1 carboxylesterase family protein [Lipingzhangella rawalii]